MLTATVPAIDFMPAVSKFFWRANGEKHVICLLKGFYCHHRKMQLLLLLVLHIPQPVLS